MSGKNAGKQSSDKQPRLDFHNATEDSHSYEQVKVHVTSPVPNQNEPTATSTPTEAGASSTHTGTSPDTLSADRPRSSTIKSQHKYDTVDFEEDNPSKEKGGEKKEQRGSGEYEVPRPVSSINNQQVVRTATSEYNVPVSSAPAPPRDQYMTLGDRTTTESEYKVPVRRKKIKLFQKKSKSSSTTAIAASEGEEPDYEEGQVVYGWRERLRKLRCTDYVHFVLLVIAIIVATIALLISLVSIGVSSSKSCNCPSPVVDPSQLNAVYNCTTSSVSTCSIALTNQSSSCLTPLPDLSTILDEEGSLQFRCAVEPHGEERPVTASMVYNEGDNITGSSPSVRCLCFVVETNEIQQQVMNIDEVECVLKATQCIVDFSNNLQ